MPENLVYIFLPVAKLLADKDKRIEQFETENEKLMCKLEQVTEQVEQEEIKDIYDFYGVSRSDFY